MAAIINQLIDKKDTNEFIRDKLGVILFEEKEEQKVLANGLGKNPDEWDFDVYIERSKPWEILTNQVGQEIGELQKGLVNILFDNDSFDVKGSGNFARQKAEGIFFIDCYAHKNSNPTESGDEATSKESDRIARLVRNILMYANYLYLGMQGVVTRRYIIKREKLQPDIKQEGFENIVVTRVTLKVDYEEYAFEKMPEILEEVYGECKISDTGQIYFDVNYDYTT